MIILRAFVILSVVGSLALSGCGSSSSKSADAGTTTGGPKMCAPATSTCTAAETSAYSTCVQNACNTLYTKCLGSNYKSGTFSGVCGTYFNCLNACACNDTACTITCPASEACATCLLGGDNCSGSCTVPACYSAGAGTGGTTGTGGTPGSGTGGVKGTGTGGITAPGTGGTAGSGAGGSPPAGTSCAALLACCSASTIQVVKDSCGTLVMAAMNDEATCATALSTYKSSFCPNQ